MATLDTFNIADDRVYYKKLYDGMFSAYKQSIRLASILSNNGVLSIYSSNNYDKVSGVVQLCNRRLYMVANCLSEYGFCTDRTFVSNLLRSLTCCSLTLKEGSELEKKVVENINKLSEKINEFARKNNINLKNYNFNSFFWSFQQIYYCLKFSNNIDEFLDSLTINESATTMCGDFYVDSSYIPQFKK
jgi:hypothetical protein